MTQRPDGYVPAAGHDWLLPLYDPLLRLLGESSFKRRLVAESAIEPGHRVLDLGCGTGTLTLMIKQQHPHSEVRGLDGDPGALAVARRKIARAGIAVALDEGFSFDLPYEDASFDRVLSSLVFHHLNRQEKLRSFREVRRILKPGGSLLIADFGRPASFLGATLASAMRHGDRLGDNLAGRLVELMEEAGFARAEELGRHRSLLLTLCLYRASRA